VHRVCVVFWRYNAPVPSGREPIVDHPDSSHPPLRFGVFELNADTGELP